MAENIVTSTEAFLELRYINSSGSVITASDYDNADYFLKANTSFVERQQTNFDSFFDFNLSIGSVSGGAGNTIAYIFNPTNASSYTYAVFEAQNVFDDSGTFAFGQKGISVLKQANVITGLNFISSSGTHTANFKVYGLRVDN